MTMAVAMHPPREQPFVSCLCCTYGRPHLLPQAIESFLRQDYAHRELVILDDAAQYPDGLCGERWRIVSVSNRYPTLGEKRNALASWAAPEATVFAVWDDDDIYLPWHLSAAVRALEDADLSIASQCILHLRTEIKLFPTQNLFHSGWVYRRAAFAAVEGYPAQNNGEDQVFGERLRKAGMTIADPCQFARPSLVYRVDESTYHLSLAGRRGYDRLPKQLSIEPVAKVTPYWDRDWVAVLEDLHSQLATTR